MGMDAIISLPGLATTAITGTLTLTKLGTSPQVATFPAADIEVQGTREIVQANWTARNHGAYTAIATATATDPSTPAAGHEFTTIVRNGTITIGGTAYSTPGAAVTRLWHSGSWTNYVYPHLDGAWTWTAAQTFSATARFNATEAISLGMAAIAGNGLLQLASGTTRANGIALGTDAGLHRPFAGFVSSEALGTANDAGYRALRSGGASLVMFSSTGSAFVGTDNAFPMGFRTNGFDRAVIKTTGQIRFVPLSADPSGAETGDVYYNSTTNKLRVYNGAWVDLH